MNRRRFLALGAGGLGMLAAGRAVALADGPDLLFVHGGTNTTHLFASNAQLWINELKAGRSGPKPTSITQGERYEDLGRLAALGTPGAPSYHAVVIYAWWGTQHGGSLNEAQREGLRRYVAGGGGLVVAHIGNGCFDDWPEYHKIVGGVWVTGKSTHTAIKPFSVKIRDKEHAITRSLDDFKITDELYQRLVMTPGAHVHVLATATEAGVDEPMAWTNTYEKGRIFYCALGHGPEAWGNKHFQKLMNAGLLWARRAI